MEEEIFNVTIYRPIGSSHPDYPSLVYPVNYGYIEGVIAPDGENQDAYVIGVDTPVDQFTGKRIAIIHRRDDVEDKWVITPENVPYNKQQIEDMGEMLHNQSDMSFKESMKLCRANYVTLRIARKLIAGQNAAEAAGEAEYTIAFDKEEFSCFRKLAAE